MTGERKLHFEYDCIMQEVDAIKRKLSKLCTISTINMDLNLILNSATNVLSSEVQKGDIVVLNVTHIGTTSSTGNAVIDIIVQDEIVLERNVVFGEYTVVSSMVLEIQQTGIMTINIQPLEELIPLKIDNVQLLVLSKL